VCVQGVCGVNVYKREVDLAGRTGLSVTIEARNSLQRYTRLSSLLGIHQNHQPVDVCDIGGLRQRQCQCQRPAMIAFMSGVLIL